MLNTTYYYRVRAYNGNGTSGNSNVVNVATLSTTGPPVVITNPATLIASFSATLNGSVDPHGLTTTVYFQYGTTTSYGPPLFLRSRPGTRIRVSAPILSGLTASTTYHFRIEATTAQARYGADLTFNTLSATGPPVVTTSPRNLDLELFSHAQWLSRSARAAHYGLFPIRYDDQLRPHHGPPRVRAETRTRISAPILVA